MLVMTASPAFAAAVYLNSMESQVNNGLGTQINLGSSSSYDVSSGDTLAWQNVLKNQDNTDVSVYCGITARSSAGVTTQIQYTLGQITYGQTIGPCLPAQDVTASPSGLFQKLNYYSTSSSNIFSGSSCSITDYIY